MPSFLVCRRRGTVGLVDAQDPAALKKARDEAAQQIKQRQDEVSWRGLCVSTRRFFCFFVFFFGYSEDAVRLWSKPPGVGSSADERGSPLCTVGVGLVHGGGLRVLTIPRASRRSLGGVAEP